jgi:hypothetical protein
MLVLDKARALDRMVYLSDRKGNAVPTEFLRSAPLTWTVDAVGRRSLAGEMVLRASAPHTLLEGAPVRGAGGRAGWLAPSLEQLKRPPAERTSLGVATCASMCR